MALVTGHDLYLRGAATLLAAWEAYAQGSDGGALRRLPGVAAAVFPRGPERAVYNNALVERGLGAAERAAAVDAMDAAYRAAGVDRYAAWVHESDEGMRAELTGRGYTIAESTRAMGMTLDDLPAEDPGVEIAEADLAEHVRMIAVPGLLSRADSSAFHVLVAGESVCTGFAFDHQNDCGVFNVSTLEGARRRGLGTALTVRLLHDGAARGCTTASLQSTPIAEGVYARVGFRDLGRILEFVP